MIDHSIIAPPDKAKLTFCWIEKVGCTAFKRLFADRDGVGRGRPTGGELRDAGREHVVFYRDPLDRFLSGFLDKCLGRSRVYCMMIFGAENKTFDEAVLSLVGRDKHSMDAHFLQQSDHCDGIGYGNAMDRFTTYRLDPSTSREIVAAMLKRHGLTAPNFDMIFPPNATRTATAPLGRRHPHAHNTNANGMVEAYYSNPIHVGIVVDFYLDDYINFKIPLPPYAKRALLGLQRGAHLLERRLQEKS